MEATDNTQQVQSAKEDDYIKFDYSLETPEERNELVKKIIENTPPEKLTRTYLKAMGNYIVEACEEEIKEHRIITKNRWKNTINVREVSLEGLSASFENRYKEGGASNTAEDYKNAAKMLMRRLK